MPYHDRKWNVTDVRTAEELGKKIAGTNYCGCVGFRCNGILWLNDSSGPDGAQEWAVIRERDGRQCESITTGWLDEDKDAAMVVKYQELYAGGAKPQFGEGQTLRDGALEHLQPCRLCA